VTGSCSERALCLALNRLQTTPRLPQDERPALRRTLFQKTNARAVDRGKTLDRLAQISLPRRET
jgi:hypothetical protein